MKKRKILISFSLGMVFALHGRGVHAEETTLSNQGAMEYVIDTSPTTPLHPDYPSVETDMPATGMAGPLSFDTPPFFDFNPYQSYGNNPPRKASVQDQIYKAHPMQTVYLLPGSDMPAWEFTNPSVQITDKRLLNDGWELYAQQISEYATPKGHELKGTKMTFTNVDANSDRLPQEWTPATYSFSLTASANSVLVAKAGKEQGMGTWIIRFGGKWAGLPEGTQTGVESEHVSLFVPGESMKTKGYYRAKILWTLVASVP